MTLVNHIRRKDILVHLKWWDVLIVTIIMFGSAIYNSFLIFSTVQEQVATSSNFIEFTAAMNWQAFWNQSILLLCAFFYLWLRHFDFSQWRVRVNGKAILLGILLFLGVGLIFDFYFIGVDYLFPPVDSGVYEQQVVSTIHPLLKRLSEIDISLLIYSALNGFYEEIFFLGICLSVNPAQKNYFLVYSLIVRYSFHTYQGNASALAIGFILGGIFYLVYRRMKEKNLFPFFLSHAIGDVFGVGILNYLIG